MLSRSHQVKALLARLPIADGLASRFVAGGDLDAVVAVARTLVVDGRSVTLAQLSPTAYDEDQAEAAVVASLQLLEALHAEGLARSSELSLRLGAIGLAIPDTGAKVALENARRIARAARFAGTAVTLDMATHSSVEVTLETLRDLRKDFPETGATLQASLRRTEDDCRALAFEGSRVRLCKGGYREPGTVAFTDRHEIDKSYVRCLKVLMAGQGYPMVATHDPRLIKIAGALATRYGRVQGSYEFQLFHGIRGEEQKRLVEIGEQVRIYVPYGGEWYGYLMRSLAARPANLTSFVRSLVSQK